MSGLLEADSVRLHWVYDCGSNQVEALDRSITNVASKGKVDLLFISHLDKDHVHGVDTLLGETKVTEVVLPYLDTAAKLLVAARAAANGGLTVTLASLIDDPVSWFSSRGVERVSFVQPDDDDGSELGGIELFGGPGDREDPREFTWIRSTATQSLQKPKRLPPTWQPLGAALALKSVDWLLIPYAHKPSAKKLLDFRRKLYATFKGKHTSKGFLLSIVRNATERKKLRQCYDAVWKDHNLVSMSLYAGPQTAHWHLDCSPRGQRHHCCLFHGAYEAGWLLTGDMHLDVAVRRKRFLDFYRPVLNRVNVFGLPHHGSRHNFNQNLLGEMPNLTQAVAASGPNTYGHPSSWVKDCVESTGCEFVKVSDRGRSVLIWKHQN